MYQVHQHTHETFGNNNTPHRLVVIVRTNPCILRLVTQSMFNTNVSDTMIEFSWYRDDSARVIKLWHIQTM